jgi:hypothetical protein
MSSPISRPSGDASLTQGTQDKPIQNNREQGISLSILLGVINDATVSAKAKLDQMQARRSSISIADMFDMQMLMNHLSQLSEMSTSVVSAANTSVGSMARNIKS